MFFTKQLPGSLQRSKFGIFRIQHQHAVTIDLRGNSRGEPRVDSKAEHLGAAQLFKIDLSIVASPLTCDTVASVVA